LVWPTKPYQTKPKPTLFTIDFSSQTFIALCRNAAVCFPFSFRYYFVVSFVSFEKEEKINCSKIYTFGSLLLQDLLEKRLILKQINHFSNTHRRCEGATNSNNAQRVNFEPYAPNELTKNQGKLVLCRYGSVEIGLIEREQAEYCEYRCAANRKHELPMENPNVNFVEINNCTSTTLIRSLAGCWVGTYVTNSPELKS
jgi:hypothetical protein